jgi:hypothetical protein
MQPRCKDGDLGIRRRLRNQPRARFARLREVSLRERLSTIVQENDV